jgi:hypothetical protein
VKRAVGLTSPNHVGTRVDCYSFLTSETSLSHLINMGNHFTSIMCKTKTTNKPTAALPDMADVSVSCDTARFPSLVSSADPLSFIRLVQTTPHLPFEIYSVISGHLVGNSMFGTAANLNLVCKAIHLETLPTLYETLLCDRCIPKSWENKGFRYTK